MVLWILFWGHNIIGLYLGVISMHFRVADVNYHHDCWLGVTIKDIPAA